MLQQPKQLQPENKKNSIVVVEILFVAFFLERKDRIGDLERVEVSPSSLCNVKAEVKFAEISFLRGTKDDSNTSPNVLCLVVLYSIL